jgi:PAS domain S-box-containing protein
VIVTAFLAVVAGDDYRLGTVYVAIVAAVALLVGTGPAIVCSVLSAIGASWALVPPVQSMGMELPEGPVSIIVFLLSCVAVIGIVHQRDAAIRRLALTRQAEADEREGRLRAAEAELMAERRATEASAVLDALTRQAPVGFGFVDRSLRFRFANDELARILGLSVEGMLGRPLRDLAPDVWEAVKPLADQVIGTGHPLVDVEVQGSTPGYPDEDRDWLLSFYPVRTGGGQVLGLGSTVVDMTERGRLLDELADVQARLAGVFTADVLAVMAGVGDLVTEANDALLRLIGRTRDELDAGRLRWTELTPPGWEEADRRSLDQLYRTGRCDPFEKEYWHADGRRVPVQVGVFAVRREPLEWIAYVADLTERRRAERLLQQAFAERDEVARTLQESLLPPRLPSIAGARLAGRYLPSSVGDGIGGDFYDVFPAPKGWHVVVGDVCGKGVEAAALTSFARYTLRAAVVTTDDPAEALRTVNEAAVGTELPDGRFWTAAHLVLRPADTGGWWVDVALGGHHQPRLVHDGRVHRVGRFGGLLGVFAEVTVSTVSERLAPGDLMVVFTDGLIEQEPAFGEGELDGLLAAAAADGLGADATAELLLEQVADAARDDDVAVLVIEAVGEDG